jgi:hypothetical protein
MDRWYHIAPACGSFLPGTIPWSKVKADWADHYTCVINEKYLHKGVFQSIDEYFLFGPDRIDKIGNSGHPSGNVYRNMREAAAGFTLVIRSRVDFLVVAGKNLEPYQIRAERKFVQISQ